MIKRFRRKVTMCTVRLRPSESKTMKRWCLVIESFPVYKRESITPVRTREALNRFVTTPMFDSVTGKVLRDANGVIKCKSKVDQASCLFADKVREMRQHEYDNIALYSDSEVELNDINQKKECDFIEYFKSIIAPRHRNNSLGTTIVWEITYKNLLEFTDGKPLKFSQLNVHVIEQFRNFLLNKPLGKNRHGTLSKNTASLYFSVFKAGLKQAFVDGYMLIDIATKIKRISTKETRREFLTEEELNILAQTPCDLPVLKRACLFSALTGLRHSDIKKLRWSEIQNINGSYRLNFTQQKTHGVEYMPISQQAYQLCGKRLDDNSLVFDGLPAAESISRPIKRWIRAAGIKRNITFHCMRHTFATLQLAGGTDIYTVSKMLGHTDVKTTQRYAKIVDKKKVDAASVIKIGTDIDKLGDI